MNSKRLVFPAAPAIVGLLLAAAWLVGAFGSPVAAVSAGGFWYVATWGSDANTCSTGGAPCATINAATGKAAAGDTIYVAAGVYTGSGAEVVTLDKNVALSGGWDATFSSQEAEAVIDGEYARRGMLVNGGVIASLEHFTIQRGQATSGGGIYNNGALTIESSAVISNTVSNEGGGVFIQSGGTLTLNRSSVGQNQANSGGGVFSAWGTLNANNSTFYGNFANGGGGINNLGGSVSLASSTISGNAIGTMGGGGVRNEDGSVSMKNTILAGNHGDYGPDCNGSFTSLGYNLVGDTAQCAFSSGSGDQINKDAGFFLVPLGSPAFYVLLPNSPAVDGGDPAGCKDHQGALLALDQRGTTRALDGNGDLSAICDIGAYEHDPNNPLLHMEFMPCIFRDDCHDFFDDFSNPASGWEVTDNKYEHTEYLNGEYRVAPKQDDILVFYAAPTCSRADYAVELDARWVSTPGGSYGIVFGAVADYSRFYIFEVDADLQVYSVWRMDPAGWTEVVPWAYSGAIHSGSGSNHLALTVQGSQMTLQINGSYLGAWSDGSLSGSTYVGLMVLSYYDQPNYDARFDNFAVMRLP